MKSKVEQYTEWMENLANDNFYGYSWGGWGPQDYDCGHAIITAVREAGIPVKGATYTGNMKTAFLADGFKDVAPSVNLTTGAGLRRGDILLNEANHAAVYTGNGKLAHARSSEGNSQPGDQSGNEIRIQSYFNYPDGGWDCVLRYPEAVSYDQKTPAEDLEPSSGSLEADGICGPRTWETIADMIACMPTLLCLRDARGQVIRMPSGWHVAMLQAFLNYCDPEADVDVDGEYGPLTEAAVEDFQRKH